jgi:choline dehydrogenase-like flavoprotein
MSFIDDRSLSTTTVLRARVAIVGAGAAGIALACELDAVGLEVLLVESGGFDLDQDVQRLYDHESAGVPLRPNYMARARYFGGSCKLWAGRSMLLNDVDFQQREWVAHSGWPIPADELQRWIVAAGRVLELPALDDAALARYRRHYSADESRLFEDALLTPTYSVWARNTQRFGRDFRRRLRNSRSVRVLLGHSFTSLVRDENGTRVRSIVVRSLDGRAVTIEADQFVLACGGMENARLLLAARQQRADGNASDNVSDNDWLGRGFMDHPRTVYGKLHVPANVDLRALRGRPLADGKMQIGIGLSAATQRREQLLNHYATLELRQPLGFQIDAGARSAEHDVLAQPQGNHAAFCLSRFHRRARGVAAHATATELHRGVLLRTATAVR